MQITEEEQELLEAFRKLPARAREQLSELALRLAALPGNVRIDWSDAWSEDDLREYSQAALERFDRDHRVEP